MLQQGAGSSGEPLRDLGAGSESAVEFSAKGKDEAVVQNLPEAKPKTLLGVGSTDISLQGASTSSIPAAGEGLGHLVSGVGGPRLAKKALSGCTRRKLRKARAGASKAGTVGSQQPGNAGLSKQGETPTSTFKRPRSETNPPTWETGVEVLAHFSKVMRECAVLPEVNASFLVIFNEELSEHVQIYDTGNGHLHEEEGAIHSFFAEGAKHVRLWAITNMFQGDTWIFAAPPTYRTTAQYFEFLSFTVFI
ncbi:hypothetical protein B7P43_G05680 [Cryptotermes secundus]|uniref:Uncharacterized protein n=1 Tax=Cryptotermes secundus TaxID=105785 RepID=A0A2J7RFK5_9NEOP|nr:hypothetical protein B7P43_G05680 [Cryptotermes secundus]